jgi:hypothetical protein
MRSNKLRLTLSVTSSGLLIIMDKGGVAANDLPKSFLESVP